jgi:hypothetical protein
MPDTAPYYYAAYILTALLIVGYVATLIFRWRKEIGTE